MTKLKLSILLCYTHAVSKWFELKTKCIVGKTVLGYHNLIVCLLICWEKKTNLMWLIKQMTCKLDYFFWTTKAVKLNAFCNLARSHKWPAWVLCKWKNNNAWKSNNQIAKNYWFVCMSYIMRQGNWPKHSSAHACICWTKWVEFQLQGWCYDKWYSSCLLHILLTLYEKTKLKIRRCSPGLEIKYVWKSFIQL